MNPSDMARPIGSESPERAGTCCWIAALVAVVLFGAGLWLNTRANQFAYYYHPDEFKKVEQVLSGERNFNHPLVLLSASETAWKLAGKPPGKQQVVELGRWVSAIFSALGTVAFFLAAWTWRGPLAGVVTGLLLTANHQVFELAHYMKEDPVLYFGTGLTAWALAAFAKRPAAVPAWLLGAAVGVAFSGKYLGVILLAPAFALVLIQPTRAKWKWAALVLLGMVVVFVALNFRIFTELDTFRHSFDKEMDWSIHGQKELTRRVPHAIYLNIFVANTTPIIWLLIVLFFVQLWKRHRSPEGIPAIDWCLFGSLLGWLVLLSFSPKTNDRYFLPLTGLIYLLAGAGASWAATRWPRPVVLGLLVAGLAWDGLETARFYQAFRVDDRANLTAWIRQNIPANETIAYDSRANLPDEEVYHDLAYTLPNRLLREQFVADIGTEPELIGKGVRYVVISESTYGRFFLESLRPKNHADPDYRRRADFYQSLKSHKPLWTAERGTVLYLHPGLEVYALKN